MISSLAIRRRRTRPPDGWAVGLLVFYVLAMQCLAPQAVTRRETNAWKGSAVQLLYLSGLAYGASGLVFQALRAAGIQ